MQSRASALPRRAFLGLTLPPGDPFGPDGMRIAGVQPGATAALAGMLPTDRLVSVDGRAVRARCAFDRAARDAAGRETVELEVLRAGATTTLRGPVRPWPSEAVAGQRVLYEHVERDGARLRVIVTTPEGHDAVGTVYVVPGFGCVSVDYGAAPDAPLASLVHGWARDGFTTVRVDKRGVGDSEGECCEDVGFAVEVDDFRAGLAWARARGFADPDRTILFGHSVGAVTAAMLAPEVAARGVVVYGAPALRWGECLDASARRQLVLKGAPEDRVDQLVADQRARTFETDGAGRTPAYHRELDAIDPEALWSALEAPVLVARGEHDWVVGEGEMVRIAAWTGGRAVTLPGVDHAMTRHESVEHSVRSYGEGPFEPALLDATSGWMRGLLLRH